MTDGTIRINAQGVTRAALLNAIQIVPSPALQVSPGSLSFTGFAGGASPSAQSVNIANAGAGTLAWTASKTQPWLNLSANSGTGAAALSVTVFNPSKTYWTGADDQDPPYYGPGGENPELYNLDSVAYESVMVGMFSWFYPRLGYKDYQLPGPTLVELGVGFSHDGFS